MQAGFILKTLYKWPLAALALSALLPLRGFAGQGFAESYPTADEYLGEHMQVGEVEDAANLIETLKAQIRAQYYPGVARRDAHPKPHGCVGATLTVDENIPESLIAGVFQPGAKYRAVARFSNGSPSPNAPDINGDTRGMALKLFGVPGEKFFESPDNKDTQDFIFISSPVFFINSAADYAKFFEVTDNGTKLEMLKLPLMLGVKGAENAIKMLGQTIANPLETRYWSVVPYQLGLGATRQAVKYSMRPCNPPTSTIPDNPGPNYLREAMVKTLSEGEACMDFLIQPRTSPDMDVEDSITEWREKDAPFYHVATLVIPQQDFNTAAQNTACENRSFNPWNALPEHKPLGVISRTRRVVYQAISELRHEMNGYDETRN